MDNQQPITINTNARSAIVIGVLVIVLGLGSFFAWASLAPLGKGVVSPGVVSVEANHKAVQHLYGGIIEDIAVRENDIVTQNQVLMRLNETKARAEYASARSEYLTELANRARLVTERSGMDRIEFPQELQHAAQNDPDIASLLDTQRELMQSRQSGPRQEKQILRENIQNLERYIQSLQDVLESRSRQIDMLSSEIQSITSLTEDGYYPRNKLTDLQRNLEEITARRAEDLGNISRTQGQIAELRLQIAKIDQEYRKEVETQLAETQRRLSSLRERYLAAQDVLERTTIRSPDSGIVLSLATHTIGGVIRPGDTIMKIVPQDSELIIEAQVKPQDIDKVARDMQADIRFSAFDSKNTPTLLGDVIAISPDRLVNEQNDQPYYQTQIRVSPQEIAKLPAGSRLLPGMPAEVVIKTGDRTMLEYLIDPFLDRLFVSFKED